MMLMTWSDFNVLLGGDRGGQGGGSNVGLIVGVSVAVPVAIAVVAVAVLVAVAIDRHRRQLVMKRHLQRSKLVVGFSFSDL
jgi:hypothetical protein